MPALTMGFPGVDGPDAHSTHDVFNRSDGFEVFGVNARTIPAQVVDNQTLRYRPDGPLIGQAVGQILRMLGAGTPKTTVAGVGVSLALPNPACAHDLNLGGETPQPFHRGIFEYIEDEGIALLPNLFQSVSPAVFARAVRATIVLAVKSVREIPIGRKGQQAVAHFANLGGLHSSNYTIDKPNYPERKEASC